MRFLALAMVGLACGSLAFACGGSDNNTFDLPGVDGGDGGPQDDVSLPQFPEASLVDTAKVFGCSPDLRNVIDGNGTVLQTCPPDQGCSGGQCVAACDAAAAAHGSVGCDYVVATPSFFADLYPSYFSPCWAVFLANNWPKDVVVTVSRNGQTYNVSQFGRIPKVGQTPAQWAPIPSTGIPPGQVGILFMESDPSSNYKCPAGPALLQGTQVAGSGRGLAWHVSASFPVSGYDILPFGGASSYLPGATLLLPTSAWGNNYVGVVPKQGSGSQAGAGGPHWGQIVAFQDGTTVDVVPTVTLKGGMNVAAAPQNVKTTYNLKAGEFVQWQADFKYGSGGSPMDLSGSIIASNNPIAFNSGNGYLCLGSATSSGGGCDSDHEQIPPVQALGSEYAVAPYGRDPSLQESILYRFVGTTDGTTLTYEPQVPGAPTTLKLGQMAEFEAKGAFVVKSQDAQHPFYVGQMMTGCNLIGGTESSLGDEDYTNILPPAQFLSKYVFFTDLTYGTTNFSIVRTKTSSGFKDVNVDCLGVVKGWKPMGSSGTYEYTTVDIIRHQIPVGSCQNGPHTATSDGPFGITVWGMDSAASYGYPAGGNVASINTVVIPAQPH